MNYIKTLTTAAVYELNGREVLVPRVSPVGRRAEPWRDWGYEDADAMLSACQRAQYAAMRRMCDELR